MIKKKNLYIVLLVGIAFVAISYCMTANALGRRYGSIYQLSKLILFCFILGFGSLDVGRNCRHLSISGVDVILAGMVLWNCLITYVNGGLNVTTFIDIALWPLVFICSEKWGKEIIFSDSIRKPLICISFAVIAFSIPNLFTRYTGLDRAGYAVGAVYSVLMLLPFLLTLKKDNLQKVLIAGVVLVALVSSKRTALLSTVLALVCYFLFDAIISNKRERAKKILKMIGLCIFLGAVMYLVIQKLNLDILDRLNSITEDGGSGRDEIWESVIWGFENSPLSQKLFGHGYHSVAALRGRGQLAHNDYLEILYDYGVVGIFFTMMFVLTLLCRLLKLWKVKSPLFPVYIASMILFIIFSVASYFMVQSLRNMFLIAFLGAIDPAVKSAEFTGRGEIPYEQSY